MRPQWQREPREACGILCAADENLEWLLPWWWERYSEHNDLPVAFVDFGMSEAAKQWCSARGELIPLAIDTSFVAPRSNIDTERVKDWEKTYGSEVWSARTSWFKKPFAFLSTPFQKSVWLDLDCEVLGPLDPLFTHCTASLGLVRDFYTDHLPLYDERVRYNGGVVFFEHGTAILVELAEEAMRQSHLMWSDDLILANLIHKHKWPVVELPPEYNWRLSRGFTLDAVVIHWMGSGGKAYIRAHGGLKGTIDTFRNCR